MQYKYVLKLSDGRGTYADVAREFFLPHASKVLFLAPSVTFLFLFVPQYLGNG